MKRVGSLIGLTAILLNSAAQPTHAYIDPGSSSMLLQVIVGGLAAVLVMTRRLWEGTIQRVRRFVRPHPEPAESGTARPSRTESKE